MNSIIKIFLLAALPVSLHAYVLVDTFADYTNVGQGINGLSYGYYTTAESETGEFTTDFVLPSGDDWVGSESFGTVHFSSTVQHPGVDTLRPAVRRFTVAPAESMFSYTGMVQISGSFGGPTPGGGGLVSGFVTVDGTVLYSATADFDTIASFSFAAPVGPGSTIDFGLRSEGDPSFDSTLYSATVSTIPEPASTATLVGGSLLAVALLQKRRRKTQSRIHVARSI